MLEDLIAERLKKLTNFQGAGFLPYPAESQRTHWAKEIALDQGGVVVAGRIKGLRLQGGVFFADVYDESGKIQAVVRKDNFKDFDLFRDNLDIADFIEVSGDTFKTTKGELSIDVRHLRLLAKALRPLPDQWSGLEDQELRLRQRYLDILEHSEVKDLFIKKALFWDACRSFLRKSGFLEVETPVLESIPGGADAEPFVTHHNALNADFYLRISLELPLKKLLVGGYEKVFEIGRIFRNEGIDKEHLQDYTQCEFYWAYQDYRGLMRFVEKLYKNIIKKTTGNLVTSFNDQPINWGNKWQKIDYYKVFKQYAGLDLKKAKEKDLFDKAKEIDARPEQHLGRGRLIDLLFKKLVRSNLMEPCFLIDPPADIEPLAKRHRKYADKVERFQVVACGTELGKGFSENNDPLDQRKRFEEQVKLREAGDREAQRLDETFLEAMEYGLPPAAGFGLSERLFAILMNKPLRETVIFPLMKPKK